MTHFDTFGHSLVAVFQILTGENWNAVLYDGIRSVGWSSVAYYVSLFVVGHIIVLTLFLAVTMEAFESKYDPKASREARVVAKLLRKKRERRKKRQVSLF